MEVRFTVLYAVVFLLSGAALLGLTVLLADGGASDMVPAGPADADPVQFARHLQEQLSAVRQQQTRQLLIGALAALAVLAVLSVLVGRALARRVLRPLRRLASATRRISADSLDQRLAVDGPADEVKDLADTIDELLARLEASFAAQRRFVADASHELRTPLTTMRALVDVAAAKPDAPRATVALTGRLRGQLDRVDHLLDGFLVLARAQHGGFADAAVVDIGDLVSAAVRETAAEAERKGLSVRVTLPVLPVEGSPPLLARLIGNVVDNAVRHNEAGGWIDIDGSISGADLLLAVETGGPVLDQRDVDRLSRPFARLGAERTGSTGLGLSIVAAVAEAHGGRLGLFARPGGGLRVTVALPRAEVVAA